MIKVNVCEAAPQSEISKDAKVISTTWAMKKRSNSAFRVWLKWISEWVCWMQDWSNLHPNKVYAICFVTELWRL